MHCAHRSPLVGVCPLVHAQAVPLQGFSASASCAHHQDRWCSPACIQQAQHGWHQRHSRGSLLIARASLTSNDLRNGLPILINGEPWKVLEFMHVKPGKGSAVVRTKLKSLKRGTVQEKTFRAGEPLEKADITGRTCILSYIEGDNYVFMDMESYEEVKVPKDPAWANFVAEGTEVEVQEFNGTIINIDLPAAMVLEVTQCDPGVKGNTSQGATKPATMSTGLTLQVPLHIEEGMWLKVDTKEGKYISRAEAS